MSMGRTSRSLRSIAHTSAVRFAGFQSRAYSCAHAMGVPIIEDGSRASGPPLRGLFEYPHKVQDGELFIKAGELPTPGQAANRVQGRPTCA